MSPLNFTFGPKPTLDACFAARQFAENCHSNSRCVEFVSRRGHARSDAFLSIVYPPEPGAAEHVCYFLSHF